MAGFMIAAGISSLILAFLPKDHATLILLVYLLAKGCTSGANTCQWVYTAELYPTNLRSQSMGFCSTVSRIFGLSSSFMGELARYWTPLPMLILALPSILGGILGLRLPETTGQPLPQTMEEAFELKANNAKYYSATYEILD